MHPVSPAAAQTPFGDPMAILAVRDFLPLDGFGERHPDAPAELDQFGQLAGIWTGQQEMRTQDGGWMEVGPALWAWRYALGGFAVRDLWFQAADQLPAYLGNLGRDYLLSGTRIYSPASNRWEIAWIANGLSQAPGQDFGIFQATWEDDRIVMTSPEGASPQRVTFSDFTPDSFLWTSEFSQDGGQSWIAVMRVRATRVR
ncbi:MAG: hypothetical protein KJO11_03490 [Gemmatimonadetes bacterium]|nr:hypothetical protein [Gemmatimonadota bacterium]NNK62917.1 hypothetical protein [Gemmatimonadota bacterium]